MDEKKVSQAQRRATNKYLEKFDEIRVRVLKGHKQTIQDHCESRGESMNSFITQAINEKMERDKGETE